MIKEQTKFIPSTIFEGMTSIRAIIKSIDENISDRRLIKILYDKNKSTKISKELRYFKAVSDKYGFELCKSNSEQLDKITLGNSHGGLVAIAGERTIPHISHEFIKNNTGFYCMIEGIEDPYNFGYALRSLYACGVDGIVLPERNWMSSAGIVCRSSAGASELLPMCSASSTECAKLFKEHGFTIICADINTNEILGETSLLMPLLLIVGGEKRGISSATLSFADKLVKIPYGRDFNASLSSASATTIFAYEILRQKKLK